MADDEENGSQPEPEEVIQDPDNMMYEEVILYRQAESDKVCIYVEPSVLRDYQFYYYIPVLQTLRSLYQQDQTDNSLISPVA